MEINRYHIKSPAEVIITNLGILEDYKQKCIQEAYKIGDKQNKQTNVKAIMSSYMVWEETDIYNLLANKIIDLIKRITFIDNRFDLKLQSMWTAIYKEEHYTLSHDHLPSTISFVYYLKADKDSSPLVFNNSDFYVHPYDDLLVIFPGYLAHSVPEHKGGDRVCIAGNLSWVLKEEL